MRLEQWLKDKKLTASEFADLIRVDVSTITRLIPREGKKQVRHPSYDLVEKIKAGTRGAVTANDFMAAPPAVDGAGRVAAE